MARKTIEQRLAELDAQRATLKARLSKQETVVFQTMSRALDSDKSGISYGEQHTARPLLTPDEVRNLPAHAELLFLAGQRPIVAGKLAYYADPEFRGLYDAPSTPRPSARQEAPRAGARGANPVR